MHPGGELARLGVDDALLDGLRACLSDIGAANLVRRPATTPRAATTAFEADSADGAVIVDVASTDEGRARILAEVNGRSWASAGGVSTPRIIEHDATGTWLVSRRAETVVRDEEYVDAAMSAAAQVASIATPPPAHASSWRAPRRGRGARVARCVREGVPARLFVRARAAYAALPHDTVCHGDYYYRNVLSDGHGLCLIDWEFVGLRPRHTDQMRFWATLPEQHLRDRVMSRTLDSADPDDHRAIGTVALWTALRLLAENAGVPRSQRNMATLRVARSGLAEARHLASRLDVARPRHGRSL